MTFAKGIALALAFVGAVALGVLIGPHITSRGATVETSRGATVENSTATPPQVQATDNNKEQPARQARRASASRPGAKHTTREATSKTAAATPPGATPRTVPAAAPALHERLKPLLNKGADMGVASQDFADAQQFAAVAHAARNTEVPFMVLKHRVVNEGKSLENAIRESKPDVNAAAEAQRARAQAKSDITALEG
jgi:hypothetical protein